MGFEEKSYSAHSESYRSNSLNYWNVENMRRWFESSTIDVWRHKRMLEVIDLFLERFPQGKWLMIGDGRYGSSSIYATAKNAKAIPLDIDTCLLEEAHKSNLIPDFINGNAENLSCDDDSFDFSFCKESFHHFPRPFLALYEMLRCSSKAIMFTEPSDWIPSPIPRRLLQLIKHFLKRMIGKKIEHTDVGNYESIGNYVYTISLREFQKVAIAMNLPAIAFKRFHDVYYDRVEVEEASSSSILFLKVKLRIAINTTLSLLGLSGMNRISIVLFKKAPSDEFCKLLRGKGFKVVSLPKNPFI